MPRRGRPTTEITLSADERRTLERWTRRHSSSQALALRCRIVLACAEGRTNTEIAVDLGVNQVIPEGALVVKAVLLEEEHDFGAVAVLST